jgi:hypothetical protein
MERKERARPPCTEKKGKAAIGEVFWLARRRRSPAIAHGVLLVVQTRRKLVVLAGELLENFVDRLTKGD